MDADLRQYFDQHLDEVVQAMPEQVHRLLDEVTMYVEDHPSREVMHRLRMSCCQPAVRPVHRHSLGKSQCGTFRNLVGCRTHLSRRNPVALATDRRGHVDEQELRRQIRLTVLHELGHYHGMEREGAAQVRVLGQKGNKHR